MDCITWCLSTDVDEQRKGPQIELALGGVARHHPVLVGIELLFPHLVATDNVHHRVAFGGELQSLVNGRYSTTNDRNDA